MNNSFLAAKYNRNDFLSFLTQKFLPYDFVQTEENININDTYSKIKSAVKLGVCDSLDLSIYEFRHNSNNDPRVSLSRECFTVLGNIDYQPNALAVFYNENSSQWRLSLITSDYVQGKKTGRIKKELSYPRRFSYLLGENCKLHTPFKFLYDLGPIKEQTRNKKKYTALEDLIYRFSVEVLTKEFYDKLFNWYEWALTTAKFPKGYGRDVKLTSENNEMHLIRLITRLIFVWFIKQKQLIPDWLFNKDEVSKILKNFKSNSLKSGVYYNGIIQNLFFATLNKPINERCFTNDKNPKEDYGIKTLYRDTPSESMFIIDKKNFISLFETIPFLNGGLFECLDNFDTKEYIDGFSREEDRRAFIPNALFWGIEKNTGLIELFETYNFTVEENTPVDIDVALDPELLGKIFENLLGTFNEETKITARNGSGSFYTPREIVDYMIDTVLKEYLKSKLNTEDSVLDEYIHELFSYQFEGHRFDQKHVKIIMDAIDECKILDPACGSGAFPMGILTKFAFIMQKLDNDNKIWRKKQIGKAAIGSKEAFGIEDKEKREIRIKQIQDAFDISTGEYSNYARKLFLIENCIYGVDIQPIAIQICKLRFFISLIVDQKTGGNKENNYNVLPLPNLETKFVAANTLIGVKRDTNVFRDQQIDEKQEELLAIRHSHFTARDVKEKINLRKKDEFLSKELSMLLKKDGFYTSSDAEQLAKWNPYNQSIHSEVFDPYWMFGVESGFDMVIGNPPYVQIKHIQWNDRRLFETLYKTATGRFNLFYLFLEKSINLAKKSGLSSFIVPDRIMLNTQCTNLRNMLLNEQILLEIVSFDESIFESAVVDSVILLFKNCIDRYESIKTKDRVNLKKLDTVPYVFIPFTHFVNSPSNQFNISYNITFSNIINKIKYSSIPLGEIADIKDGVIQSKVGDKLFMSAELDNKSKKILFGSDIQRYSISYKNNWINYNPTKMSALESKRGGNGLRLRVPYIFERDKILTRQTADEIIAAFDSNKYYYANTLHGTTITDNNYDVLYVLGILNSKLMTWYYRATTAEEGKVFAQIKIALLRLLPIKIANQKYQNKIISLVKTINNNIVNIRQIDNLVYRLYNLTYEEVKIIEPDFPMSKEDYEGIMLLQ